MTQTLARIKQSGKHFEIIVNLDKALAFKKTGSGSVSDFLEIDKIFSDSKKGQIASNSDIQKSFGTENVHEIAGKIVKSGEILLTQEHRNEEREKKIKQIVEIISRNAIDPRTGNPHTSERIKNALEQAHFNIKNIPIENQINEIVSAINGIIPIKIETKKVKITIPAVYTGKAYGIVNQYKIEENWLSDGSLEIIVGVPAGMIMDFYDKLNGVTHGSSVTEDIKE